MSDVLRSDTAVLLAQAGWVRELARHLVADAHAADDLAQEALAAALVRPPPSDRPLRRWLGAIVRNLARLERRRSDARQSRERTVAREEAELSGAALLERLDVHRTVVEAVARLEEPYRRAILLRYFEGLAPAAIAARTGAPLRTVHTRLHRALGRLRTELDRADGGRAWLSALIPFAARSRDASLHASFIGALVMDAKLKLVLLALAVVGLCTTLALWPEPEVEPPAREETADLGASLEPTDAVDLRPLDPAPLEARTPVASPQVAPRTDAPAPRATLAGLVIDVERAPVANLDVVYLTAADALHELRARSGPDGRFTLAAPLGGGRLDLASPGWTCLYRPEFPDAPEAREHVLVVARSLTLAGVVRDERGRPLAGAEVSVPVAFGLRARFEAILDHARTIERSTKSDADGRFRLDEVPFVPEATLETSAPAHVADVRALPAYDELALEIVLRPARAAPERLLGRVLALGGEPAADAWVALGTSSTRSGADGAFALELADAAHDETSPAHLRAAKPGHLPAELVRAPGEPWPEPLVLHLGAPPLTIAGRVLDAEGRPLAGAEVWSDDEAHFGSLPIEGGESAARAGASVEGVLRGDPWAGRATTDSDGRFELAGLLPRDYRLRALDRAGLRLTAATFPAGTRAAELRMPVEELRARVAGRVTSLAGEPLAGVQLVLGRAPLDGGGGPDARLESRAVRTDAEGRFEFREVARGVEFLRVYGPELELMGFRAPLATGAEDLVLAVPLLARVQLQAGAQPDFDEAAFLDAQGTALTLSIHHGSSAYALGSIRLEQDRTEPFSVSELARTLVLSRNGAEVRRVPVVLAHGGLQTLRP